MEPVIKYRHNWSLLRRVEAFNLRIKFFIMPDAISSIPNFSTSYSYADKTNSQNSLSAAGKEGSNASQEQNKTASTNNAQKNENAQSSAGAELSSQQQSEVKQLAQIDREVRAHEQAHIAAGGNLVRGGASFEYQTGPDGKRYAVAGEVQIDISPVKDDPQATINKARRIRQAAMAPADPSNQDRSVAAQATKMEIAARQELAQNRSSSTATNSGSIQDNKTASGESNGTAAPQARQAYQSAAAGQGYYTSAPVLSAISA